MDDPRAFYATVLHTPELRPTLPRASTRHGGPRLASRLGPAARRSLAHTLRALADCVAAPHGMGDPRLAPAR